MRKATKAIAAVSLLFLPVDPGGTVVFTGLFAAAILAYLIKRFNLS